ncbi:Hsp20/alpha crystallin family protein [Kovacikia minuta CCNUW1]|uniref:Hsp20/alpha crystallin family protein n=1 Tax=Kovacikia minuta TaxID=2931930 RepID=UPI001CCAB766|nr:Hsp20/alpha crystallin family protein [Kovacikia minuta]UBF26919.1 Hsp20/alpha crystallin family protein [Kovacikia minuta CCNUW1]
MAIIRWQPWQEMELVRRQLDQLFDEWVPAAQPGSPASVERRTWSPAIELKNTDANVVLRAELPGLEGKDLDVQVSREAVSISGEYKFENKTETGRTVRSEFRYGSFHRVIPLPAPIYNDRVHAEFKDGILTLTLPKVEADRPKVFKVNLNGEVPAAPQPERNAEQPNAEYSPTPTEPTEMGDVWTEAA